MALWQAVRARREGDARRGLATVALMLGLFSSIVPAAQILNRVRAIVAPEPEPAELAPVDCGLVDESVTFEMRLGAPDAGGVSVPVRGAGRNVELEAEPLVTLGDVLTLAPLRESAERVRLVVTLRPQAALRLQAAAVPGRDLAVVVNGEAVSVSTVTGEMAGTFVMTVPITAEEACGIRR